MLSQFPYLQGPNHQYCARQSSALWTIHGCKIHPGETWFSSKESWCSPLVSFFNVALDNNLVSLKTNYILLLTIYEDYLIDSLVVLVPFPLSYLTLAMATLHLHKPWRPPGLVKLSLLLAWDGSSPTTKHQTHENRNISTRALVQMGSKNTNHFWFYSVVVVE